MGRRKSDEAELGDMGTAASTPSLETPETNGDAPPGKKLLKSKRERFMSVFPRRMTKALVALTHVARCGNRAGYEYADDEWQRAMQTLHVALLAAIDAGKEKKASKQLYQL